MRQAQPVDQCDERRCAIEEREGALHPVGADRHLTAVDAIRELNFLRPLSLNAPAILAGFGERQGLAAIAGHHDSFHVTGVFADQVRARRPDRHEDFDVRLTARDGEMSFDRDVVGLRIGKAHGVTDGGGLRTKRLCGYCHHQCHRQPAHRKNSPSITTNPMELRIAPSTTDACQETHLN